MSWLCAARLRRHEPSLLLRSYGTQAVQLQRRLVTATQQRLKGQSAQLQELHRALSTVSPLGTLDRGYAIVTRHPSGEVLRSADQVEAGNRVNARLARGMLRCTVDETEKH